MEDAMLIPREEIEIGKTPGGWVLTYWLPKDVTLRFKIMNTCSDEPDNYIAEVRLKPDEEFQVIHKFMIAVYSVLHPDEHPDVWDDLPDVWTRAFASMVQIWARLTDIAEFGASIVDRYAGEPQSSLDYFWLGKTEDRGTTT